MIIDNDVLIKTLEKEVWRLKKRMNETSDRLISARERAEQDMVMETRCESALSIALGEEKDREE